VVLGRKREPLGEAGSCKIRSIYQQKLELNYVGVPRQHGPLVHRGAERGGRRADIHLSNTKELGLAR